EWISFLDSDDVYVPGGLGLVQAALVEVPADIDVVGFMTSRETGEGVLLQGGVRVDDEWSSYVPSYSDTLFKENIRGDINFWLRRSVFEDGYRFAEYVNGFEVAFFAKLAKDRKKFLYINKTTYLALDGGDVHLSAEPYKRWPRQFARAYREFVDEHYEMLSTRPDVLRHFYNHIGKCMLRSGNPLGMWWIVRTFTIRGF
ncbi:MAG: hypothetical protein B7W98_00830, partial [Parcubacteria group bacterium 20-58-5]